MVVGDREGLFLEQGESPLPQGTNIMTYWLSHLGNSKFQTHFHFDAVQPDVQVTETMQLESPFDDIFLVPTPGHSMGSISIVIKDEIALVGDTLFGIFKHSIFPPYADDVEAMIESWEVLLDTNCHTFLPGHGSAISRKRLEKCLKNQKPVKR